MFKAWCCVGFGSKEVFIEAEIGNTMAKMGYFGFKYTQGQFKRRNLHKWINGRGKRMATWHTTDQTKIEKWLETANRQKFKTPTPILTLAQIIFYIHGEYIASSFEFVSSRNPEKNPFQKVYLYVFWKCHKLFIDCWRTERYRRTENICSSVHLKGQRTCVMWM